MFDFALSLDAADKAARREGDFVAVLHRATGSIGEPVELSHGLERADRRNMAVSMPIMVLFTTSNDSKNSDIPG